VRQALAAGMVALPPLPVHRHRVRSHLPLPVVRL
jgi:hypothetical protein